MNTLLQYVTNYPCSGHPTSGVFDTGTNPRIPEYGTSVTPGSSSIDIDVPGPSNATFRVNDNANYFTVVSPDDEIVRELEERSNGDEVGLEDNSVVEADGDQLSSSGDKEVMSDYPVGPQNLYDWRVDKNNVKFHPTLFEFNETNSGINLNIPLQNGCSDLDLF